MRPWAVLEELEREEVGVDVIPDALDRVLVRGELEHGEQEHAGDRGDGRGREPARQDGNGGEQERSQETRHGAQPCGPLREDVCHSM